MQRKLFEKAVLLVMFTMVLLLSPLALEGMPVEAAEVAHEELAVKLQKYGIIQGSDKGFELGRELTRAEGAAMLVRLLGDESYALKHQLKHPFTDVPDWASDYVGYLYTKQLTQGVSSTSFGSQDKMTSNQYATFILRTLGYDDSQGDFIWNQAVDKAREIALLDLTNYKKLTSSQNFLRDDMVYLSAMALDSRVKDRNYSLLESLIARKAVKPILDSTSYPKINFGQDNLLKIETNRDKGYNVPYYLFVPKEISQGENKYLLVESNNAGRQDDDHAFFDQDALRQLDTGIARYTSGLIKVPILIPTFVRPNADGGIYTHGLTKQTMEITEGDLRRIDLQMIAMIEEAQDILRHNGLLIEEKIIMTGYSGSATFNNRFTAMYPERVRAIVSGGANGMPSILPLAELEGKTLNYPIGIANLEELIGRAFDLEEYRQVAQYIYMGDIDDRDSVYGPDAYNDEDRELVLEILGQEMYPDRWYKVEDIFAEMGISAQFVTYEGVGHRLDRHQIEDSRNFIQENIKIREGLTKIKPYKYRYIDKELEIIGAYWKNDEYPFSEAANNRLRGRFLSNQQLALIVEEFQEDTTEVLRGFWDNAGSNFVLRAEGQEDIHLVPRASFGKEPTGYLYGFNDKDFDKLEDGVRYELVHLGKSDEYKFIIADGVYVEKRKD